jgi:hypothetical protein
VDFLDVAGNVIEQPPHIVERTLDEPTGPPFLLVNEAVLVPDELLFDGWRYPPRNIKPLANGFAQQVQSVLQGDLLTRSVFNERYMLDEIKDGNTVREFTPQSAFNALPRRHSIPGKFARR